MSMILKKCIMSNSTCYKQTKDNVKMTGIVVHDTGCNNVNLSRYVQPCDDDPDAPFIWTDIGKNKYGNDWNHKERQAGVHAFIGKNAHNVIEVYEVLPYTKAAWGVGSGKNGSYNFAPSARIQFEMCADDYTDESYFNDMMKNAQEYCAYLCQKFLFDPRSRICSHYEAYHEGMGNNHGDCDEWLSKFGKDMNWFRDCVTEIIAEKTPYIGFNLNDGVMGFFANETEANKTCGVTRIERIGKCHDDIINAHESITEDDINEWIADTYNTPVNSVESECKEEKKEEEKGANEECGGWIFSIIKAIIKFFAQLFANKS